MVLHGNFSKLNLLYSNELIYQLLRSHKVKWNVLDRATSHHYLNNTNYCSWQPPQLYHFHSFPFESYTLFHRRTIWRFLGYIWKSFSAPAKLLYQFPYFHGDLCKICSMDMGKMAYLLLWRKWSKWNILREKKKWLAGQTVILVHKWLTSQSIDNFLEFCELWKSNSRCNRTNGRVDIFVCFRAVGAQSFC